MQNAKYITKNLKNVPWINLVSDRLNNKCVACFNLAVASLHLDDTLGMIKELYQLELFITPSMNVYKNLVQTGFDQILFKKDFLQNLLTLEEMLYLVMHGHDSLKLTEEQTKGSLNLINKIY